MLDGDDLKIFIKICGRLGSDQDGEFLAAARTAAGFLEKRKLTWEEVLTPPEAMMVLSVSATGAEPYREPPPPPPSAFASWVIAARACLANPHGLKGDRERGFLDDLMRRVAIYPGLTLSQRQELWLLDICGRCGVATTWVP